MNDSDKTIAPQRNRITVPVDDVTVPGRRVRKTQERFTPGDVILKRYKILSELGQGGMGVVYKCFDEVAGIEIALKALPPELSHNTLEMEDIRYNFQLVSKLAHQNIAVTRNLERDEATGDYYLIMEYVNGEDLRHWIRLNRSDNGSLNIQTVLPLLRQIALALDYAHSEKIIHRDIKPGNIMLTHDGKIKVLDFGLAAQIHTSMSRVSAAYYGTSGTGPYMAPEQWRGRAQGAASDQYAFAVMIYEMLAGRLPFENSEVAVLREIVLNEMPEPLIGVAPCVQNAISRGLSKDPAMRFECCMDFVSALDGKKIAGKKKTASTGKGKIFAAVAILFLFVAVGYGTWLYFNRLPVQHQQVSMGGASDEKVKNPPNVIDTGTHEAAEEAKRKAEEAAKRKAEEERLAEEKRKLEEQKRQLEEDRLRLAKEKRLAEEKRKLEEQKRQLEEERKAAEAARKAAEEEAKHKAAEEAAKRKAAEEEAKRKAAEEVAARKAAEEEAKRKANEVQKRQQTENLHKQEQRRIVQKLVADSRKNAEIFCTQKNYNAAIREYKKIPQKEMKLTDYQLLGKCYFELNDFANAETHLLEAYKMGFNDPDCLLVRLYMNQQNYSRCVDVLNKLVEKDNPKAMLYLSVIYLQGRGGYTNLEEGKRLLILSANKGLPSAQFNLGCCYAKLKGMNFDVFEYSLSNAKYYLTLAKKNGISRADDILKSLGE